MDGCVERRRGRMKKWFSEYKKEIALSVAATLLPVIVGLLLWNRLPDRIVTHWGGDGVADGTSGKAFAVFGLPAVCAVLNLLAFVITATEFHKRPQNKKAVRMLFGIFPLISWAVCGVIYALALEKTVAPIIVVPLLLGAVFLLIGNYMPKVKQNSTLGIKVFWTLRNEENWNKTHRLAGKVWVAGGVVMMAMILLPTEWMLPILLADIVAMVAVPMIYSYCVYRKHVAQGISYAPRAEEKEQQIGKVLAGVVGVLLFAGIMVLMVTGDITCTVEADLLRIEASYAVDLMISYGEIESLELRESFDKGSRNFGFGSPRLSVGAFENAEFGRYTLYAYTACDSVILLRSGDEVLAINGKTAEDTRALYEALLRKVS